jgi:hypothetical protein
VVFVFAVLKCLFFKAAVDNYKQDIAIDEKTTIKNLCLSDNLSD